MHIKAFILKYDELPLSTEEIHHIHHNYEAAMLRRRSYVLEYERFVTYIQRPDIHSVCLGKSYIFGTIQNNVFVPTHFAPFGIREGAELIRELQKTAVAFVVPDDLGTMLKKMGYKEIPFSKHKVCFADIRGNIEKKIYISSYAAILKAIAFNIFLKLKTKMFNIYKNIHYKMNRTILSIFDKEDRFI